MTHYSKKKKKTLSGVPENSCFLLRTFLWDVMGFTIYHLSRIFFYWRFLIYVISTEKWNKKGKYPNGVQIFTFLPKHRPVWRQIFQKKYQMLIWSENAFKKNLMLQFSWQEEFCYGKISRWWTLDELQYEHGLNNQV